MAGCCMWWREGVGARGKVTKVGTGKGIPRVKLWEVIERLPPSRPPHSVRVKILR